MLLEGQIFKVEKLIGDWIQKEPEMSNANKVILLMLENQAVMMKEIIARKKTDMEFRGLIRKYIQSK